MAPTRSNAGHAAVMRRSTFTIPGLFNVMVVKGVKNVYDWESWGGCEHLISSGGEHTRSGWKAISWYTERIHHTRTCLRPNIQIQRPALDIQEPYWDSVSTLHHLKIRKDPRCPNKQNQVEGSQLEMMGWCHLDLTTSCCFLLIWTCIAFLWASRKCLNFSISSCWSANPCEEVAWLLVFSSDQWWPLIISSTHFNNFL